MNATAADLARLAAKGRVVLKDEPAALVEILGDGAEAVVRKTYRNLGVRWLQTWCRRSRAQREHEHLTAIAAAGVPSVRPVGWEAERRFGGFARSTIVTRFLPGSVPLKDVLRQLPADAGGGRLRGHLAAAMGALVADLHHRGFLWGTPMPRNVLVVGDPRQASLVVCDTPLCIDFGRDVHGGRLARIDLFLGAFSPSRRRDWTRPDRLRWLLGYTAGDRAAARALWRVLAHRWPLRNVVERSLAIGLFTYILARPRPRSHPIEPAR